MKKRVVVRLFLTLFVILPSAFAQNFEISGHIGRQFNGGVDLSTAFFQRLEVSDSMNYGATAGYLFGGYYGVEFQWNHTRADTSGQPFGGGPDVKIFTMNQNQYMGNFLLHFKGQESRLRPFAFIGLGASALSTNHPDVSGATRFAFAFGGGAKYNLSRHFGLRGQAKYSPTYLTSTHEGYWCDPFWGGCWSVGNDHYLHEFDLSGGITLRF